MKPNRVVPGLIVGMLTLFVGTAYATEHESHVAQARQHAQMAVDAGNQDQARGVVEHAQQALTHAQMAEKVKSDQHIAAAEQSLNDAIKYTGMGRADIAARSAGKAIKHLDMAYGSKTPG